MFGTQQFVITETTDNIPVYFQGELIAKQSILFIDLTANELDFINIVDESSHIIELPCPLISSEDAQIFIDFTKLYLQNPFNDLIDLGASDAKFPHIPLDGLVNINIANYMNKYTSTELEGQYRRIIRMLYVANYLYSIPYIKICMAKIICGIRETKSDTNGLKSWDKIRLMFDIEEEYDPNLKIRHNVANDQQYTFMYSNLYQSINNV